MSEFDHDEKVEKALHNFEVGGRTLVGVARKRIASALDQVDDGNFLKAIEALGAGISALRPLADAQQSIAFSVGADLIDVKDLEVGMEMIGHGRVEYIDGPQFCGEGCEGHVVVVFEGNRRLGLSMENEVYVKHQDAS